MNTEKSLNGKRILVACSAKKMSALSDGLERLGALVLPLPVIEIKAVEDLAPLRGALERIARYDWIIFTSVHGVIHFFNTCGSREFPTPPRFCAVGPATADALKGYGIEPDLVPERFIAEGIIESLESFCGGLEELAGRRILLPRAKIARDVLPRALKSAGAEVEIVACYETVRAEIGQEEIRRLKNSSPDLMVFTSSSTVVNMMETLGNAEARDLLSRSVVAAIGPITADTLSTYGKRADIVPEESTIASLIRAIETYCSSPQGSVDSRQR
jgi:uroporphyrinogen III methyltransferase/synthase